MGFGGGGEDDDLNCTASEFISGSVDVNVGRSGSELSKVLPQPPPLLESESPQQPLLTAAAAAAPASKSVTVCLPSIIDANSKSKPVPL